MDLFKIVLKSIDLVVLAEFFMDLGFDLTDTLAGYAELLPHPLQRMLNNVGEPLAHLQNVPLFGAKLA